MSGTPFTNPSPRKRGADEDTVPHNHKRMHLPKGAEPPPEKASDYLQLILTSPVQEFVKQTPLDKARMLPERCGGHRIFLKREDTQHTFSTYARSAYQQVHALSAEERCKGIVACSLGNFGHGVVQAMGKLGLSGTICVPLNTSSMHLAPLEGCEVIKVGAEFYETELHAAKLASDRGVPLLHPYNGHLPIAAMGTIAVEIYRQLAAAGVKGGTPDVVYVPVGSGEVLAGVAAYTHAIFPSVEVVGVEARGNCAMSESLRAGREVTLESNLNGFVDGTAVASPGSEAFAVCKELSPRIITVDNDDVCVAIKDLFEETRQVLEPAGALAWAGMKKDLLGTHTQRTAVALLTSANMEFTRLRGIAERCEEKEVLLSVTLPEIPGAFRRMYSMIYPRAVTEFSYRYSEENAKRKEAFIFMSVQVDSPDDGRHLIEALSREGMPCKSLKDNEMATTHARYLVGGCGAPRDERLLRFIFPESAEALNRFLAALPDDINITLFHYRNHGSDFGKVLVGFNVPPFHEHRFANFLKSVHYTYVDETSNSVYRLFLR